MLFGGRLTILQFSRYLLKHWQSMLSSLALRNAASVRDSRCAAENIYFSGELRNRNQSLTTIQRTHTAKIKTIINTKLEWRHRGQESYYCKIFLSFMFSILQLKLKFPTPSSDLFDLKSYRSTLSFILFFNPKNHHWFRLPSAPFDLKFSSDWRWCEVIIICFVWSCLWPGSGHVICSGPVKHSADLNLKLLHNICGPGIVMRPAHASLSLAWHINNQTEIIKS